MVTPDEGLSALKSISNKYANFCNKHGEVSEADTRVNLIDKILVDVLGWPESAIKREKHVHAGYIDYELIVREKPLVCIEAKKSGKAFVFPIQKRQRKSMKLDGAVLTSSEIKEAIHQVRVYCDEAAIRYAVTTNGYAWIIFRAIREDIPWRKSTALIFPSLEYIAENFTAFWNLLSFDAVSNSSLDAEFSSTVKVNRELHRVIDILFNADLPLLRNRLHSQLHPLIRLVFEDITGENQEEILQSCYVHYRSLKVVARDIGVAIRDSIPEFLKREHAKPLLEGEEHAGMFGNSLESGVESSRGMLCLLLGGIGSGKTTFLKRYQATVGRKLLQEKAIWFHVDFLKAPLDPSTLENYVWRTVLSQLRTNYASPILETRKNIKRAFSKEIMALRQTALRNVREGTEEYEEALSPYLQQWQDDIAQYVPRLLSICKPRKNMKVVLFIDNVDQLSPEYQTKIFLLAQRITRTVGTVTIVALREESYYAASIRKSFTAFTNRKFHIASPRFMDVARNRIEYAQKVLKSPSPSTDILMRDLDDQDKKDINDLLTIVKTSIFSSNRNIVRFIEAICFGNMRMALEMFTMFLTSGATDVDKMIRIFRRDGNYVVPFHEFVKSIMLGDRRYFKEEHSPMLNVSDCSIHRNGSHFTALRTLNALIAYRGQSSREGQGYMEISTLLANFEDIFDNSNDLVKTLNRLVIKELVEVNTRSTESITGASHVRVTSSGWYYSHYLTKSFCYLDLVLQDTPFNDRSLAQELKRSVYRVDNLYDREEEKIERVNARFERVDRFLSYLTNEENRERDTFYLEGKSDVIAQAIVPPILDQYEREKKYIAQRLRENREKYEEEITYGDDREETIDLSRLVKDIDDITEEVEE